jgi:RRXRR protein
MAYMQQTNRVPVVGLDDKPRMPTTPARARKWIKTGKAIPKRNKLGVFYVQLTQNSDDNTQPIIAGVDRGKCFTGIAFQSHLATIAIFHLCLPGFYKSKKTTKDRQSVTGKMAKRHELRRSRRANRIDRTKLFKIRNHREKRFSNRVKSKLPPSIRSNRQMELLVLNEMALILPIHQIRDEDCGGNTKRSGTITPFGFRSGDYVQTSRKGEIVKGWIGGFTNSGKTKNVSIYDHNWSRIGQFNPSNVSMINRSSRLCIA